MKMFNRFKKLFKFSKWIGIIGVVFITTLILNAGLPVISQPINHLLGQIGIKSTFTIAPIGTAYAATADYTVDGTADDVQAQAALNALPSTGGKLIFFGGNYNFSATVSRAINNVTIVGSGKSSYFTYNGSTPVFSAGSQTGWMFQDLRTDAGFITLAADSVVLNVWNGTSYIDRTMASGTTLPTSPVSNQMFLHTPIGRKILYQYDGSNWEPIQAYGTLTVYVDSTDGTDDLNHGYAIDSGAFKTLTYAYDMIPLKLDQPAVIYIDAETYTESFLRTPKHGSVTIVGTMTETAKTATGGTIGNGSNAPTVTGTFSAGQYNNKLIQFTSGSNNNTIRVISKTTTTNLYILSGPLSAAPQNGDTYKILDWGTVINGNIQIWDTVPSGTYTQGNGVVNFSKIKIAASSGAAAFYGNNTRVWFEYSNVSISGTASYSVYSDVNGYISLNNSVVSSSIVNSTVIESDWRAQIDLNQVKVIGGTGASSVGTWSNYNGSISLDSVEITGNARGIYSSRNGWTTCSMVNGLGNFVHGNTTYGVAADQRGAIGGTSSMGAVMVYGFELDGTVDANGGDTNADATSYSWIGS